MTRKRPEFRNINAFKDLTTYRMRRRYGYDNLWSLFYVAKEVELLGCRKIIFAEDGPPNAGEMILHNPDDIARLRVPERIEDEPAFAPVADCMRRLVAAAGHECPICAYLTSSMTLPSLLMGMHRWLEMLLNGPFNLRDELLEKCHEFFVKETLAYRRHGAGVLLYSNPFGSLDLLPRRLFDSLALPWIERDLAAIGSEGVVYYCGSARMNRVIPTIFERTRLGAYYLSPLDDVAEGSSLIAGRALTCGVINDILLLDWTHSQIVAEVRRIIDAGRSSGRFLFGTLVMPFDIPESSIRAMLETAYEAGACPPPSGRPELRRGCGS